MHIQAYAPAAGFRVRAPTAAGGVWCRVRVSVAHDASAARWDWREGLAVSAFFADAGKGDHDLENPHLHRARGKADIDLFADFMRLLAPPPAPTLTASAKAGRSLFNQVGCQNCHMQTMSTGQSAIPQLDPKAVSLYSDLLLHDMGSLGDRIAQAAGGEEMRTASLWGLLARTLYLHDGRASSVDAAILFHDGEALAARNRYSALSATQKSQLLEFLGSI